AGAAAIAGGSLLLMFRACPGNDWMPSKDGLRQQFLYAVPLGLAALAGTIDRSIDKVMVGALTTPESFAVYVNGAVEIPLIAVLTGSVAAVLVVEYNRLYREDRLVEVVALIHRAMLKCALVLIPVMLFLLCVAPELMRLVYGPTYEASATPFRIYLFLLPMRTLNFGAILMATRRSGHVLVQSVITLLANVILTYYAIAFFGAIGAAIASVVVVYLVALPYLLAVLRKVLQCPVHRLFPCRELLKVGVASLCGIFGVLVVKWLIAEWPDLFSLMASTMIWCSGTVLFFWAFGLVDPRRTLSSLYRKYQGKECEQP
ncbi:lipopolysaccharide biosynthesis protein, partial [Planctomycetota bacterium]